MIEAIQLTTREHTVIGALQRFVKEHYQANTAPTNHAFASHFCRPMRFEDEAGDYPRENYTSAQKLITVPAVFSGLDVATYYSVWRMNDGDIIISVSNRELDDILTPNILVGLGIYVDRHIQTTENRSRVYNTLMQHLTENDLDDAFKAWEQQRSNYRHPPMANDIHQATALSNQLERAYPNNTLEQIKQFLTLIGVRYGTRPRAVTGIASDRFNRYPTYRALPGSIGFKDRHGHIWLCGYYEFEHLDAEQHNQLNINPINPQEVIVTRAPDYSAYETFSGQTTISFIRQVSPYRNIAL